MATLKGLEIGREFRLTGFASELRPRYNPSESVSKGIPSVGTVGRSYPARFVRLHTADAPWFIGK